MSHSKMVQLLLNGSEIKYSPIVLMGSVLHRGQVLEYRFNKETFDYLCERAGEVASLMTDKLATALIPMVEHSQHCVIKGHPNREERLGLQVNRSLKRTLDRVIEDYRNKMREYTAAVESNPGHFSKFLTSQPDPNAVHVLLKVRVNVTSDDLHFKTELAVYDESEYISFDTVCDRTNPR